MIPSKVSVLLLLAAFFALGNMALLWCSRYANGCLLMMDACPVPLLAVCGYSGSGKTTLLTRVIPQLVKEGLEVGVIKHDAHGVQLDTPGKDSDRLFLAGGNVLLRGPNETITRWQHPAERGLFWAIQTLAPQVDLILVEGHKETPLPKVWLEHPATKELPKELVGVVRVLAWGEEREQALKEEIDSLLRAGALPVWGGILLGGQSTRMGRPKQMLQLGGESLVARLARTLSPWVKGLVYLGAGPLPLDTPPAPQLPDPPGPGGPLAGMVAALRWQPWARWLFVPVDAVAVSDNLLAWWLERWTPGKWAVMLKDPQGQVIPVFTSLAPQLREYCEGLWAQGRGPVAIAQHKKTVKLQPPESLQQELRSVNTPEEWHEVLEIQPNGTL